MTQFLCPVCGGILTQTETAYQCQNGHCYDKARGGYVNLLMSQRKKEKRHGDDKAMVLARTRFLEAGHYQPLLDTLLPMIRHYAKDPCVFLDVGCGLLQRAGLPRPESRTQAGFPRWDRYFQRGAQGLFQTGARRGAGRGKRL